MPQKIPHAGQMPLKSEKNHEYKIQMSEWVNRCLRDSMQSDCRGALPVRFAAQLSSGKASGRKESTKILGDRGSCRNDCPQYISIRRSP